MNRLDAPTGAAVDPDPDVGRTARCPRCRAEGLPSGVWNATCANCGWRGLVEHFALRSDQRERPQEELALGAAACAFHPTKQATAVCAGTGSYICPLCAVDVGGRTFSADYLSRSQAEGEQVLDRTVGRPDRLLPLLLALGLITCLAPLALIPGIYLYVRHRSLKRTSPIYAELGGARREAGLVLCLLLLVVLSGGAVLAVLT